MSMSEKPEIICNVQPQLETCVANFTSYREYKVSGSTDAPDFLRAFERTRNELFETVRSKLPNSRLSLATIELPAGESRGIMGWHADVSGLILASSILVTEFLEGEYEPLGENESGEDFRKRINQGIKTGTLAPVEGIKPGDVVLSINDGVRSALHRVTPNTLDYDVMRCLLLGSQKTA